jgi:F-type H+-transporting ATPase subunit epsilon
MPTFEFSILSPRGKAFEGAATAVSAPGSQGGFGLLAGHAPMIAAVQPGLTKVEADGKTEFYFTGEGVMEVTRRESILLVDEAEKVDSPAAATERLQKRIAKRAAAQGKS